jgi:hypothetical protein
MDKIIKISAKMDTAEFDRAIDAMQKKMRQISTAPEAAKKLITTKETLAGFGVGAGATEADRQRAARMEKEAQDRALRFAKEQMQIAERANKLYDQRETRIKQINEEISKGSKNELELKQKIAQLEEQKAQAAERSLGATKAANEALGRAGVPAGGGGGRGGAGGGGGGGGIFGGGGISDFLSGAGFGGLFRASLPLMAGALAKHAAERAVDIYTNYPRRLESAQGSAISGLVGEQTSNIFSGKNLENVLFSGFRGKALSEATKDVQREEELVKSIGISNPFSDIGLARIKKNLYDFSGGLIGSERDYGIQTSKKIAEYSEQRFQSMLNSDPLLRASLTEAMHQAPENLAYKRALGLSDVEYYNQVGTGTFTRKQLMGAGSRILEEGGSTRAAQQSAFFANKLARDYNLTNAPQVLGMLSGAMGSAKQSENALIKILAEGFDSSKFAQENRKFVEMSTQLFYNAGLKTQEGAAYTAGMLKTMVGAEPTMRGLKSAKSVFETIQDITSETSGPQGAIKQAFFLRGGFGKLGVGTQELLARMSQAEVMEGSDNPAIVSAARQIYGSDSPENIKKVQMTLLQGQRGMMNMGTGDVDVLRKKLKATPTVSKQYQDLSAEYIGQLGRTYGVEGTANLQNFGAAMLMSPEEFIAMSKREKALPATAKGKLEDDFNVISAAGDKVTSEVLKKKSEELTTSFGNNVKAINDHTENLLKLNEKLARAIREGSLKEQESAREALQNLYKNSPLNVRLPETPEKADAP